MGKLSRLTTFDVLTPACRSAGSAVASGAYLKEWDRDLSEGQSWPDVIEYART